MKRTLYLIITLISIAFASRAQTPVNNNTPTLNEKTIVKDSTGKVLEYAYWQLMLRSGNYSLRSTYRSTDTTHVLRRLTAEEKQRFASMRSQNTPSPASVRVDADAAPAAAPSVNYTTPLGPLPRQSEAFPPGAKLNMLTAKDMAGKRVDNKTVEGKIVVLNFWFIGCPPCRAEIPELNKLVAENSTDPDITFIAVSLDKSWEVNDFVKKTPFNYRQVPEAYRFCAGYGVNLFPTNVIIDKKGIIRYSSVGYGDNYIKWMKKTIEDIKNEN
jgi:thiol-disulfide isomerase/thioredoxin